MSRRVGKGRFFVEIMKGLAVLALLVGLMLWLAGSFVEKVEPGPPVHRPKPPPVSRVPVQRRTFPLLIDQVGTVRSQTHAQIASRVMAQVREILVREGEAVQGPDGEGGAATILARLDDRDIRARFQQASAQLAATERGLESARARLRAARARLRAAKANEEKVLSDYRRYEDLRRNQAATGQQLEHIRAQKEVAAAQVIAARQEVEAGQVEIQRLGAQIHRAKAAMTEAQVMLSYTVIRAPFSGRVVRKLVDVGNTVSPGQPLFTLEIPSRPELHAVVSESLLRHLQLGQTLKVSIDALNSELEGVVREIIPQADPATRTVSVKVSLPPEPGLVTGLFGRLRIPYGQYEGLVIPTDSVRQVGQLHLVDVVDDDGFPERRFVTLGKRRDGFVEVLSGLREGEEVILP